VSDLDRVHARIMLTEMLRDTAPPIDEWGAELLEDCHLLSLELAFRIDREAAARRSAGRKEGGLEKS
jgi:hypothetical protein